MDDRLTDFTRSLESIEWSKNNYNLSVFLAQHGPTLPHVVKVSEGYCGVASSCTIDSGQHLILHALHKETKILAKDSKDYDLLIPKKFQVKVEMIPKNAFEEYSSVQELLRTFPNYFRVLEHIPSLKVTSNSIFKIVRQNTFTNYIECLQVGKDENEGKTQFLLTQRGRFQPLQDSREFFLDEVFMEDSLPVTVHFVKSTNTCTKGNNKVSLDELGNVRLIGECETESVFATVLNSNGKSLAVFPKNLNITVQPAEITDIYKALRNGIIENQDKTLKRIQRLNKLGLYQARNPIRQFPIIDIPPPIFPKLRTQSMDDSPGNTSELVKERSSSTPPQPTMQLSMATSPQKRPGTKKSLKGSCSVPLPHGQSVQHLKNGQKHPAHKPPPIPVLQDEAPPPLPLKEKDKPKQSQDRVTQQSPTTPTPPPRRRRKTTKKGTEVPSEIIDDEGYVKMNPCDGVKVHDEYEQMNRSFLSSSLPSSENNDNEFDSNKTLEELFGVADSHNETEKCNGTDYTDINHNTNVNITDSPAADDKSHDYYNMKNLDLTKVSEDKDIHDYENTKGLEIPGKNCVQDGDIHDYENTKGIPGKYCDEEGNEHDYENTKALDPSTLSGKSFDGNKNNIDKNFETGAKQAPVHTENREIQNRRYAYENTGHLNREFPQEITASTSSKDESFCSFDDTKLANLQSFGANTSDEDDLSYINTSRSNFKRETQIGPTSRNSKTLAGNTSDVDDPGYENTSGLNISRESDPTSFHNKRFEMPRSVQNKTLTMTDQLVQEIAQRRLSPIGMEEQLLNDEEQYTSMDENNLCTKPKLQNKTFEKNDGACYVAMDETNRDSAIYENETSDDDYAEPANSRERRDSCYEEINLPLLRNTNDPSSRDRRQGDGSSNAIDSEELHYHDVDLSTLFTCESERIDDDVYEDIDMPNIASAEKPRQIPTRPTPPSRRGRLERNLTKSEGESKSNSFKTPPTSPPMLSSSLPVDSRISIHSQNTTTTSSDFEYIDDMQLHMAIHDSLKVIKKANITRPPAPPPKKLNYVKVDAKTGVTVKPTIKTQPTNYSDIVATQKPAQLSKDDDMEYIDDCELHIFQKETLKMEKKRKKELKKIAEREPSNQAAKTSPDDGNQPKYESPKSRDVREPIQKGSRDLNKPAKPIIPNSHDNKGPIGNDSRDLSKPIKPILPRKPTLKAESIPTTTTANEHNTTEKSPGKLTIAPRMSMIKDENLNGKPSTTTTNEQNTLGKLTSTDSFSKKRALLPPPKPKRLFLNNNEHPENKIDEVQSSGSVQQSPSDSIPRQTHQKREGTRKKPLPLPRKKVGREDSLT